MNKIFVSLICVFSINILSNNTQAQSVKGKVWQSQDSTFRYKPSTFVTNIDGSFSYIEYQFVNNELYSNNAMFSEGKYTEAKGKLNFIIYKSGYNVFEQSYPVHWLNNSEFILTEGIIKHHYAELGTSADQFTPKYLIPYLKIKVDKKEPIDDCYNKLVENIKANKIAINQKYSNNVVEKSEVTKKSASDDNEIGEFYSTVAGKIFTLTHPNYTAEYNFRIDGTYSMNVNQQMQDGVHIIEESGNYEQARDSIVFKPKASVEKDLFNEGGATIRPAVSSNGFNSYTEKLTWVNDYMFRMKFNKVRRLFVAK